MTLATTVINEDISDTEEVFEEALEDINYEAEDCNNLDSDILTLAHEEIGENECNRVESVGEVQQWLKSQTHLKNCRTDKNFILRFLRTNKYNVDKSCLMMERYLKMRMAHPKWFQNLDIEVGGSKLKFILLDCLSKDKLYTI